jgi:hypothetical protein
MTMAKSPVTCTQPPKHESNRVFQRVKKATKTFRQRRASGFNEIEVEVLPVNDGLIQSSSSKRRYMRRGSRAPSMMFELAAAISDANEPSFDADNVYNVKSKHDHGCQTLEERQHMRHSSIAMLIGLQLQQSIFFQATSLDTESCMQKQKSESLHES